MLLTALGKAEPLISAAAHQKRSLTDGQTDGRTDGRYQVHYLPRFAVDNKTKYLTDTFWLFLFVLSIAIICDAW